MMPSRLSRQADCRTASPGSVKCSTYLISALIQQLLQPCLAVREWKTAQVLALHKQEIESEVGQFFGVSVGQCGLQGGEIRRAVVIECDDFAVHDAVIQTARSVSNGRKIRRPV